MSACLPQVIAHRGGRKWAPENTMSAFRKSLEAGCDGIELDIHRCSTGELVVIHDDDVQRTTNGVGLVRDITYAELQRLDAGTWFDKAFKGERIPPLKDVLDLIRGRLLINIEIKNCPVDYPGIDDDLLEMLSTYQHQETIIISSFDHQVIRKIHSKTSQYKLALLADALFVDLKDYARKVGTTFWHPCFGSLRPEAVTDAHASGLKVNAWTVNTAREWSQGVAMGLDGIVTDDPAGLRAYLSRIASPPPG